MPLAAGWTEAGFISPSHEPAEGAVTPAGLLASTLIPLPSVLPTVVRRILLGPKSEPVTESYSEPSMAPPHPEHIPRPRAWPPLTFTPLTSCAPTPPHPLCSSHTHLLSFPKLFPTSGPLHFLFSIPAMLFCRRFA